MRQSPSLCIFILNIFNCPLTDGGGVRDHDDRTLDLGKVTSRHDGRGLVVDADLEDGGAPVDELDRALGLDGGDGRVDILGDDVTTVHEDARHVLSVARVTLDHHVRGLEDRVGDLGNRELLVVGLLGGDDRGERAQREVDPRVRDKVRLELGHVDGQGTVEAERGRDGRDALGDEAVEVGVGRAVG